MGVMPDTSKGMTLFSGPVLAQTSTGIGARIPHFDEILATRPAVGFLEVHSENFFAAGGPQPAYLEKLRALYPVSLHGVGLSLGSAESLNTEHLQKLKNLVRRIQPALVSEHLSWSGTGGIHLPDLLPLPMTEEALAVIACNIDEAQDALGRPILIENPSAYLAFVEQDMTEPEFLAALVKKTGCGLLLDINNIHVSAHNTGFDADAYLAAIPAYSVMEIHLAGYQINIVDGHEIFIDAHNNRVYPAVWDLYEKALKRFGNVATLIEWDTDIPALSVLLDEAAKSDAIRKKLFQEALHVRTA